MARMKPLISGIERCSQSENTTTDNTITVENVQRHRHNNELQQRTAPRSPLANHETNAIHQRQSSGNYHLVLKQQNHMKAYHQRCTIIFIQLTKITTNLSNGSAYHDTINHHNLIQNEYLIN